MIGMSIFQLSIVVGSDERRNLDNLSGVIDAKEREFLKSIVYRDTEEKVQEWKHFCANHAQKKVRGTCSHNDCAISQYNPFRLV
jgi:hypothetical protein